MKKRVLAALGTGLAAGVAAYLGTWLVSSGPDAKIATIVAVVTCVLTFFQSAAKTDAS